MTRTDHLLVILMEESAEVAQRASKALRFGLDEREIDNGDSPGHQRPTNAERIVEECLDFQATYLMLREEGLLPKFSAEKVAAALSRKKERVETWLTYSRNRGRLK